MNRSQTDPLRRRRPLVVIASDKFKGSFSSLEVGIALEAGIPESITEISVLVAADGGEGTMEALHHAIGGSLHRSIVSDALGRPVHAEYAILSDGRAVIDAAQAVGLSRLGRSELDPIRGSTIGVGELVAAAASRGASEVILAAGGTATVDGGVGAISVLKAVKQLPPLRVACDVQTPWERAAEIYGPQKGADAASVQVLSDRLESLASRWRRDPRGRAMTGCGGGLSGGLWACFGAELVPGARVVLDSIGFDQAVDRAALVVTGEGQLDGQTSDGKLVAVVAEQCRKAGIPCLAVVGRNALSEEQSRLIGLSGVLVASTPDALRLAGRRIAQIAVGVTDGSLKRDGWIS